MKITALTKSEARVRKVTVFLVDIKSHSRFNDLRKKYIFLYNIFNNHFIANFIVSYYLKIITIEWIIDNKEYKLLSTFIKKKTESLDVWEIETLQNFFKYADAGRKIIKFIEILETYEEYLLSNDSIKKSSQRYGVLFHIVANLTLTDWKVSNYKLFEPFNILKNRSNSDWWAQYEYFRTSNSIYQ